MRSRNRLKVDRLKAEVRSRITDTGHGFSYEEIQI